MHPLFRRLCVVGGAVAVLGGVSHAQAADPLVFQVPGNPTCESFLTNIGPVTEFKIDPPADLTNRAINGGSINVTVNRVGTNARSLDWNSTGVPINCIVVKGGPVGANIYYYGQDGSFGDTGLVTPGGHNISHYTIAYGLEGGSASPQVGFLECIDQDAICSVFDGQPAVVYIFNPNDPLKQFAFEQNGVVGPSRCACNVSPLQQCSPEFGDDDACITPDTPANAQTVVLELQAIQGSVGDPCVTIGGKRVCEK